MKNPPSFYRLGLIGYPVSHSLSPRLHQAALASTGLAGEYRLYPISPWETSQPPAELADLLKEMRLGKLHGLNVTVPHKQAVIPFLEKITSTAQAIGAVNTLFMKEGVLTGENTDAPGFLADLQVVFGEILAREKGARHALILGAGGSARAVCYALLSEGWQVTIAARRVEQAVALARAMEAVFRAKPGLVDVISLAEPQEELQVALGRQFRNAGASQLIVNTTPAGMTPDLDGCPWPEKIPFPAGAVVYDLVYNPGETKLVRLARQAGLLAANGLGMLVEQAALAFECWTGQVPDRKQMSAAVQMKGSDAAPLPDRR